MMRTIRSEVTFRSPFTLNTTLGELPAGTYVIEVDEEDISVGELTVYRRVATLLIVQGPGTSRTVQVDPTEIEAALKADADRLVVS